MAAEINPPQMVCVDVRVQIKLYAVCMWMAEAQINPELRFEWLPSCKINPFKQRGR